MSGEDLPPPDVHNRPRTLGTLPRGWLLVLLHLLGAIGGYCAALIGVPLPWLIGALVVRATAKLSLDWPEPPLATRRIGQIVVASSVGFFLTPEALVEVLQSSVPILLSAAFVILIGSLIGLGQALLGGFDRATAMFSCIPGGPVEMAALAEVHGGDVGGVAVAQALRIIAIVCIIPPVLLLSGGTVPNPADAAQSVNLFGLPITLAVATGFV